jgi:hypothetical protein
MGWSVKNIGQLSMPLTIRVGPSCIIRELLVAHRAGQSYVGALLCSPDGQWLTAAAQGTVKYERIHTLQFGIRLVL